MSKIQIKQTKNNSTNIKLGGSVFVQETQVKRRFPSMKIWFSGLIVVTVIQPT